MDENLVPIRDLKKRLAFNGSLPDFKRHRSLIDACKRYKIILLGIKATELPPPLREEYTDHLLELTKKHLRLRPDILTWEDLQSDPKWRKSGKILHDFGLRAELFLNRKNEKPPKPETHITIEELHEICQIRFNYSGSVASFKKYLQKTYGSYAEYCLEKGYDINATSWEDPDAALRCAKKIGSIDEILKKSKSLYNYLEKNDLLAYINDKHT